jgi:hypothetical protein
MPAANAAPAGAAAGTTEMDISRSANRPIVPDGTATATSGNPLESPPPDAVLHNLDAVHDVAVVGTQHGAVLGTTAAPSAAAAAAALHACLHAPLDTFGPTPTVRQPHQHAAVVDPAVVDKHVDAVNGITNAAVTTAVPAAVRPPYPPLQEPPAPSNRPWPTSSVQ